MWVAWSRLQWLGSKDDKLGLLAWTIYTLISILYPEIKNVGFAGKGFADQGSPVSGTDLDRLVQQWRSRLAESEREGAPGSGAVRMAALYGTARTSPNHRGWTGPGLGDDTSRAAALRSSLKDIWASAARPAFYSQLEKSIESVPDRLATMAAPQCKLWLDANADKLGVKNDEIESSGVKDYLDLRGQDKVTRDELVSYLRDNGLKVEDVVLKDGGYMLDADRQIVSVQTELNAESDQDKAKADGGQDGMFAPSPEYGYTDANGHLNDPTPSDDGRVDSTAGSSANDSVRGRDGRLQRRA